MTVNAISVCSLLYIKRQALSLLVTICADIRIPIALRTLSQSFDLLWSWRNVFFQEWDALAYRVLTPPVVLKCCTNLHMVVQWTPNDTETALTVISPSNIPMARRSSFCGSPLRCPVKPLLTRQILFLLFWTVLQNKLSMKSTFGNHKQVKHPYCTCSWFAARNDSGKTLLYLH